MDILSDGQKVLHAELSELEQWMEEGFKTRLRTFGKDLLCYSPTAYPYKIKDHKQKNQFNFVSLSVTGTACSLNCEHCSGTLLKGMESTITPETLYDRCSEIKSAGGEGVLISGGSDSTGHVPLARFADAIAKVKEELDLQMVVHTGLVDSKTAQLLAEAKIDAAMLDVIGDEEVSRRVYHIENGPQQMKESLRILEELSVPTVPHVLVGLDYGKLNGELEALEIISHGSPAALVIIALNPVRNTPMEGINPPSPIDIGRILTIARLGMQDIPVLLGCARPMREHKIETDRFAIKCGANGIALISQEGVDLARGLGLTPHFFDVCCSLAYLTAT